MIKKEKGPPQGSPKADERSEGNGFSHSRSEATGAATSKNLFRFLGLCPLRCGR